MGRVCLCTLILLLNGCAAVKQYAQRDYYSQPFCYIKGKYDREKHKAYAGVSCRF